MRRYQRWFWMVALVAVMVGCGGSGGSSNDNTTNGNSNSSSNNGNGSGVNGADTVSPVIILHGDANMSLYVDRAYTEPGATAMDDTDGDLTSSITISGDVNTSKVGTYTLTYSVSDSAGNVATATRTVHVLSALKKTGQTKSYDENGNEVTDGSVKDDGYYQTGVTPSYSRDDTKEIVTDNITGLQWQDDADASSVTKNWSDAKTYCENLTLGGYSGWRLPTIYELMFIIDHGRSFPAIDPIFQNGRYYDGNFYYAYWSSTSLVLDNSYARAVYFYEGTDREIMKGYSLNVRCVRAGE